MGVVEDLKKTCKGKLQYTTEINVKKLTDELSTPPKLAAYHHESPTKRSDNRVTESLQPFEDEKTDKSKDDRDSDEVVSKDAGKKGDNSKKSNISTYTSPQAAKQYRSSCVRICKYEEMCEEKARSLMEAKEKEFAKKDEELKMMVEQKANELEEKQQMEMRRLFEQTAKLQLKERNEASKRSKEMIDKHIARKKMQDEMLLEGERKKKQLQEEERKRSEIEKRQTMIKQFFVKIKILHDKLLSEYDACLYKSHIPEAGQKPRQMIGQIMAKAETTLQKANPLPDDVQTMKNLLEYAKNTYDFMHTHIDEATNKAKAEESEKAKQQQLQEQQKAAAEKAQAEAEAQAKKSAAAGRSVIDEVVTEYETYKAKLDTIQKQLAPFTTNTQMKKYRFELQKSVNMPINAISPVDGGHLRDKLQKLIHLLAGHQIEGKHVSAKDAPEGIAFCKNLIAKMFVKKGEEQVSSKHESAFAIAMVAVGLWYEHHDLGELMLAHFQSFCPYIVPLYFPKDGNMSTQEYHKLLGYKVDEDGTIEAQDKFLKRMSGIMRLYAAILVSSPPRANCIHPHGIEHAWIWLTRVLNMDPEPDITATLTYDMLQVTGHALYSTYKVQFVKLLFILFKDFLPQLQRVSVAGGPVARLKLYLEQTLNNFKMKQSMAPPEGYLQQNFWFT